VISSLIGGFSLMQYAISDYVSFLPDLSRARLRLIPLDADPSAARAGTAPVAFLAVEAATGAEAGRAHVLGPLDAAGTTRLEYRTTRDFEAAPGHGELVCALVEAAFAGGCERVELRVPVPDGGAIRAALAAGLRHEGVQRLAAAGEAHGRAVFARLAGDPAAPIAPALPELPEGGLTDGVITLRIAGACDTPALHAESSNPEALRWALGEAPSHSAVAENAARARLHWLVGPHGLLVIVDQASGQTAGRLVLRSVVPPKVADVGYGVLPAFRGRGFSARALRLISPWAFEVAGYARLELGVKPENRPSLSAALAGGFSPDSTRALRLRNSDGSFADEIHFAAINPRHRQASAA
jgi:RimJ/RimL family protein N-acetyltransferase